MEAVIGALSGFRGLKADLLVILKKWQPVTAHQLALQFGVTANALRRHLRALEEDGFVRHDREVRGVGAPVYGFSLTRAGEALFPRGYASVAATALEAVFSEGGVGAVNAVLESQWSQLAEEAEPVMAHMPMHERVPLVAELLTSKGYMAEAVQHLAPDDEQSFTLRIHNCAIRDIAQRFPQACVAEADFVQRLLGVPLLRTAHRLNGCSRCDYEVSRSYQIKQQQEQS